MLNIHEKAFNYPRSVENIKALLLYFFPKHPHSEIDDFSIKLYDDRKLELIEIEEVARQVNKHYALLQGEILKERLTVSCAFSYVNEAIYVYPDNRGSAARLRIIENLRNAILSSEINI